MREVGDAAEFCRAGLWAWRGDDPAVWKGVPWGSRGSRGGGEGVGVGGGVEGDGMGHPESLE